MLGGIVTALVLCNVMITSNALCDLSGDWLLNVRVRDGQQIPASNATTVSVAQKPSGRFVATSADPNITRWASREGIVQSNRHIVAWAANDATQNVTGTVQPQCSVVFWKCGGSVSSTCEGGAPLETWQRIDPFAEVVHVVYFTHLDVGYTKKTSLDVLDLYYESWFPKAFNTSRELRKRGGQEQFRWTTHPWLLEQFFNNATGKVTEAQLDNMRLAIEEGAITWHAGPMNMQWETAEPILCSYGLSIAASLDARFNKSRKTCMNQKDVPGSTIGLVPIAAKAGIKSLHVGANDFSTVPALPSKSVEMYEPCNTFVWKAPDGSELVCFWCSGYGQGYGKHAGLTPAMLVNLQPFGVNHTLVYLMTVDNSGPQSVPEVLEGWRNLKLLFPKATIVESSLEKFTEYAWAVRKRMPVVTSEVGDTWIRGTASDPTKARRYRVVARAVAEALKLGQVNESDRRVQASLRNLIKLPEHTYGSNDGLVANLPWDNTYFDAHFEDAAFQDTLAGFADQRAYIDRAVAALGHLPLRNTIEAQLAASEPSALQLTGLTKWGLDGNGAPTGSVQCGDLTLQFDNTGAISRLHSGSTRRDWADAVNTIAQFRYRSHSEVEFNAYGDRYMLPGCRAKENAGLCGFGKQDLHKAGAESKQWLPRVTAAWKDQAGSGNAAQCHIVMAYSFELEAQQKYGAPRIANLSVTSSTDAAGKTKLMLDLQYSKRKTRMAESLWLSFAPLVADPHNWRLHKLGQSVDPYDVVVNGSRAMHAIWQGISYEETGSDSMEILSFDAPIVAIDEPSPIIFLRERQIDGRSWHFNLFNNAWNTNFPTWEINEEERFRFELHGFLDRAQLGKLVI